MVVPKLYGGLNIGKYSFSNLSLCSMLYCGCSNCGGSRPSLLAIQKASVICWADHSLVPHAVALPDRTICDIDLTTVEVGV